MKFVKINDDWYEIDLSSPNENNEYTCYNMFGGHFYVRLDKTGEYLQCKNWHELFLTTGYNPLVGELDTEGWISPEGIFYPCGCENLFGHELMAEEIVNFLYGVNVDYYGDYLIEEGWKKVTNGYMWNYYNDELCWFDKFSTKEQKETFDKWKKIFIKE